MSLLILMALQAAGPEILVTASRSPVAADEIGVSATLIDERRIEALGAVQAIDLLRLAPGVSVAVSGSRGTQAQVRIRGAEANHSLLFIDGIRFTDPAAGNEARFEILSADNLGRIELVRGPQSALWGSEAIGGVVAIESAEPRPGFSVAATGEYGSRDSLRLAGGAGYGGEVAGISVNAAHNRSDGIDILGGGAGDRDGYENTTLSLKALARPGTVEVGFAGRYIDAYSEFDGTDPLTFQRADTLDNSRTETIAGRVHARVGTDPGADWGGLVQAQYLDSRNRNRDGTSALNRTQGDRFQTSAQVERRLGGHVLIAAAEYEDEGFEARDQQYFGATDQDRSRDRTAFIGEWRGRWSDRFSTDVAIRHDDFSDFRSATTFRAAALVGIGGGMSLSASYGEGIAQPTFFDLYGFFPGSFVGNPALRPERSKGWEAGIQYRSGIVAASATWFQSRLEDEIVGTFDSVTFFSSTANATGTSKRRGIELAAAMEPIAGLRLSGNYTWLDADDQQVAGTARVREVRRPKHSANAAFDWESGPLTVGGSLAYVGARTDQDFDLFPAATVRLGDYLLVGARVGYRLTEAIEAFVRGDNLGDANYQDVVGYATPGRSVHAGVRVRLGA